MNQFSPLNRRQFIAQSGCAALGTTGMLSTLLNLGVATRVMAAEPDDYKAMICIFLLGGNDSYSMLVPTNADEFAFYTSARGGLYDATNTPAGMALGAPGSGANALLPIQPSNIPGRAFGIHPSLPAFQQMFNSGNLAFPSPTSPSTSRPTSTTIRLASFLTRTSSSSGRPACPTSAAASAGPAAPWTSSRTRSRAARSRASAYRSPAPTSSRPATPSSPTP
jgi:uncharacterized protein (DUF1501 family)